MFTLFNKGNNRQLKHPLVGLWQTDSLQEAQEMLKDCKKYLTHQGLQAIVNDFVVIDVESGKEI